MIDYQRLKDVREDKDIKQKEIANILNIPRATYSMWEIGISIIPLPYLCKLSDYYELSIDYLLGLTNDRENKNLIKGLDLKILGNNLKQIRIQNKLSQKSVAELLEIKRPTIYKYENGLINISTSNLYKYSKLFKISMTELCGKTK